VKFYQEAKDAESLSDTPLLRGYRKILEDSGQAK